MFSKQLRETMNSVKLRLTLGLAAVFLACTVVAFFFIYQGLEAAMLRSVDETLREEVEECAALFEENGVEGVNEELRLEENSHDRKEVYFRVVDGEGRLLTASPGKRWEPAFDDKTMRNAPVPERTDAPVFATLSDAQTGAHVRVVYALLGPGVVVQVYHGLDDSARLLGDVRYLFLTVLSVLLLVSVMGTWFALDRTMSGVEAVTQAALDIEAGDLRRRVAIGRSGREIRRLAGAFNTMLDKVAGLVVALRNVSDDIAHELRSPIARIRGTAEMAVLQAPEANNWQEVAGSIVEDCDQLLSLVNGMLDLAEMQAGLAETGGEIVDVPRLLRDTLELFSPAAEDAGVLLETGELPAFCVKGDPQKLRRVFANLLDNAIKYTSEGGRISVSATVNGAEAVVALRDTGVGIAPEDLPHVFERFYRADKSRTKGGKGLGLGIARAIVALHGGTISVTSSPGDGSVFSVCFPIAPSEAAPRNEMEAALTRPEAHAGPANVHAPRQHY